MNDNVSKWREYLTDHHRSARLFSCFGTSVRHAPLPVADYTEATKDFISKLQGGKDDATIIAIALSLMHPRVLKFFKEDIHYLLDSLSNESVRMDEVVGPALRGNPRWDRTILAKMSGIIQAGKYYSRTSVKSFLMPENYLIRWLIDNTLKAIKYMEHRIGSKQIHRDILKLQFKAEEASRHHWISRVPIPSRLSNDMITAAKRQRRSEYRSAAVIAESHQRISSRSKFDHWAESLSLICSGWLEPVDPDDLFELYTLALCIESIETVLSGTVYTLYNPISSQSLFVASYSTPDCDINVYFDRSPTTIFGKKSKYKHIIDSHSGITGSAHRPDIIIHRIDTHGKSRCIFIDAKMSDRRQYLSESIYKGLSYIYDFDFLWNASDETPKVILVVPENVSILDIDRHIPEVAFVSGYNGNELTKILKSVLTNK